MSSDSQLMQIGEAVLSNHLNDSDINSNSDSNQSQIYLKCVELSDFLKSNDVQADSMNETLGLKLENSIDEIISLLTIAGKEPTPEIGSGKTVFEAYRLISYSLMILLKSKNSNNESDSNSSIAINAAKNDSQGANNNKMVEDYSQCICELEQARADNQKLTEENLALKHDSEQYEKLTKLLSNKFNVPDSSDFLTILSENSLNTSEISQFSEKEQEFANLIATKESQTKQIEDLQHEIESLKSINSEENVNAKIYILETDITSLKLLNQTLQNQISEQKDRFSQLNEKYKRMSTDNDSKQYQIQTMKMDLDKLMIENEELKRLIEHQRIMLHDNNSKSKDDQITAMNKIFEEFAKQIEEITNELKCVSDNRNDLLVLLHKQQLALDAIQIPNTTEPIQKEEFNSNYYIVHQLIDYLSKAGNDEIIAILSNEQEEAEERIIKSFDLLYKEKDRNQTQIIPEVKEIEEVDEQEVDVDDSYMEIEQLNDEDKILALKNQNQRICNYLISVLRFIDKISNSSETQDWMIESLATNEIRDALVAQCKRVESFVKQHQLSSDEEITFTDLPKYVPKTLNDILDKKELISIVLQSSLANDIMRKYLQNMEEQMMIQAEQIQTMKFEISHSADASVEENMRDELIVERQTRLKIQEELEQIKTELRDYIDGNTDEETKLKKARLIHKANQALKEVQAENESLLSRSFMNEDSKDYIAMLEKKIQEETEKNEVLSKEIQKISEDAKCVVKLLKKQIKSFKKTIDEKDQIINQLTSKVDNHQKVLDDKDEIHKKSESEKKQLTETIAELTKTLNEMAQQKDLELEELQKQLEEEFNQQITNLKETINQLNIELTRKDEECISKMKEFKKSHKSELHELNQQIEKQKSLSNELRNHYEPLHEELKSKLNSLRSEYDEQMKIIQNHDTEMKDIKGQLSTAKIESTMNQMKLKSAEEKWKRDRCLLETQYQMKIMSVENSKSSEIERMKIQSEKVFHDFLVDISSDFKEFIDFNSPINCQSTKIVFKNVRQKLDDMCSHLTEIDRAEDEIESIKEILQIEDRSDILPQIASLVQKANDFTRLSSEINQLEEYKSQFQDLNDKEERLNQWIKWAKRLHATITDEFSTRKTQRELMFSIEEALMASIGQRQIWRHVEILRTEKKILLSNRNSKNEPKKQKEPNWFQLIHCIKSIYRLQKLSGHLHGVITFADENTVYNVNSGKKSPNRDFSALNVLTKHNQEEMNRNQAKKYPIVTFETNL